MDFGKKDITDAHRRFWEREAAREAINYNALSAEEWLVYQKFLADDMELSGFIMDWLSKAKTDVQKERLTALMRCSFRIRFYVENMMVVRRQGTVEYLKEKSRRQLAEAEMFELRKKLEILTKENEFLTELTTKKNE